WNNYLNMRDYLNSHKEDARAYSELKESLAKQYPKDRIKYTEMKSAFINEILNKAKEWRKCIGNSGK
ncbi:MAG: GrpB family protein, partial [Treponema sp.]|nr:GrpB family protein [Treponema sp.]